MTAAHARQSPPPIATRPRKITEGDLQLTAAGGQAQIFEMTVHGGKGAQSSLEVLPVSEPHRWSPRQGPGPSTNVAQAYARFARDYREGTHLCPTFDDAVTRHRMLNAVETAAATGQRQTLRGSGEAIDRQLGSIAVTVGSI